MADLRHRRRAWRCSCSKKPRAARSSTSTPSPRRWTNTWRCSMPITPRKWAGRTPRESDLAHPRRHAAGPSAIRSASRCCSIWSALRTRTIAKCCGASSALMRPTRAPSAIGPRQAGGLRDQVLRRFRQAGEKIPRAQRQGTRRAGGPRRKAACLRQRTRPRESTVRSLRGRQAPRLRTAARLVQALYEVLFGQSAGPAGSVPSPCCSVAWKRRR